MGGTAWGHQTGEEGETVEKDLANENVPQTAHQFAGASQGAIVQPRLPSGGQTKGTIKDLEFPEFVGCG